MSVTSNAILFNSVVTLWCQWEGALSKWTAKYSSFKKIANKMTTQVQTNTQTGRRPGEEGTPLLKSTHNELLKT